MNLRKFEIGNILVTTEELEFTVDTSTLLKKFSGYFPSKQKIPEGSLVYVQGDQYNENDKSHVYLVTLLNKQTIMSMWVAERYLEDRSGKNYYYQEDGFQSVLENNSICVN